MEEHKTQEATEPCERSTASGQLCLMPSAVNLTLAWGECAKFCRLHWRKLLKNLIEMVMGASIIAYPSGEKLEARRVIFTFGPEESFMAEWERENGALFYPGFGPVERTRRVPEGAPLGISLARFLEFIQAWDFASLPEVIFIVFELRAQGIRAPVELLANWQGNTISLLGEQSNVGEDTLLLRYGARTR